MNLTFQIYDAFGDWISANGLIRHLAEGYETVTLIHDTPAVVPFTTDMFRDNPKLKQLLEHHLAIVMLWMQEFMRVIKHQIF